MLTGKFALVTGSLGGIASQPPKHWRGWRLRQEMQCDGTGFEEPEETFLSTRQPSRKFVKDENVAGLIAFLCGPTPGRRRLDRRPLACRKKRLVGKKAGRIAADLMALLALAHEFHQHPDLFRHL
jgi:hypothetical protein